VHHNKFSYWIGTQAGSRATTHATLRLRRSRIPSHLRKVLHGAVNSLLFRAFANSISSSLIQALTSVAPAPRHLVSAMEVGWTFGSVGDLFAVCELAIKLGKALGSGQASSVAQYRELRTELDSFVQVLTIVCCFCSLWLFN